MKSLQTIQKTCGVFQILTKVAMILCFVGSCLLLLGLICGIVISSTGATIAGNMETLYRLTSSESFLDITGTLLAEFVLTLTDALLFTYAYKYLSQELKDGTPFTDTGAIMVRRLGIKLIVMPIVAIVIIATIYEIFGIDAAAIDNGASVVFGIGLILVSLILNYGAELEQKNKIQEDLASFQTEEAMEGAKTFARENLEE